MPHRTTPILRASLAALAALASLLTLGCSQTTPDNADLSPDESDMRRMADLLPSDDMGACVKTLPEDQKEIDKVTTGKVTVTPAMDNQPIYTAQIDATAGGFNQFQNNPYVYIDLIKRQRVDITDVQARTSKDWDIAIKRYIIKINSGDSGTGEVTAVGLAGKALEDVSAAPATGYTADTYFDKRCMVLLDAIGGLSTVLSDWYMYDGNTMKLSALKNTYVLKRRDGKGAIKLQVMNYYDEGKPSGNYLIRWGYLP